MTNQELFKKCNELLAENGLQGRVVTSEDGQRYFIEISRKDGALSDNDLNDINAATGGSKSTDSTQAGKPPSIFGGSARPN